MGTGETILTALGLSADAFAASVCRSMGIKNQSRRDILLSSAMFGIFQAVMPLAGWFLGKGSARFISAADHWIAFGLLAFIGGRSFFGALTGEKDEISKITPDIKTLLITATATSIDALAAGAGLAFSDTDIFFTSAVTGAVTFIVCIMGAKAGNKTGEKFGVTASAAGGLILIGIGTKILTDHLLG